MTAQAEGSPGAKRFARTATDVIWLGPTQQAGVSHLCAETQVKTLIGPSSCGKTTLLRHFQHHLDDAVTLHIPGPHAGTPQVLSALLKAAAMDVADLTEDEQRSLLRVFIEQRRLVGKRIIVCADNVASFSEEAWGEIERLLSLKVSNKTLVELAVVGTKDDATSSPLGRTVEGGMTSAVEGVRYLSPPSDDDIRRYITWQLARLGTEARFSSEAYSRINELSECRFSAVNDLCDTIIFSPERNGKQRFDVDDVDRAAGLLTEPDGSTEPPAPAGEIRPDRLMISRNGKFERLLHLDRRLLIGRGETSDLRLGGPTISRHHAMIVPAGDGRFAIVDLNSSNGVLVNGERIKRRVLRNGDTVQLCQYRLKLLAAGDPSQASDASNEPQIEEMEASREAVARAHSAR